MYNHGYFFAVQCSSYGNICFRKTHPQSIFGKKCNYVVIASAILIYLDFFSLVSNISTFTWTCIFKRALMFQCCCMECILCIIRCFRNRDKERHPNNSVKAFAMYTKGQTVCVYVNGRKSEKNEALRSDFRCSLELSCNAFSLCQRDYCFVVLFALHFFLAFYWSRLQKNGVQIALVIFIQ